MSSLKTKPTGESVSDFLLSVTPDSKKIDGENLVEIFGKATNESPILWGPSIIGFGSYQYKYPNGKIMEWFPVGFSPRKNSISIYLMISHEELKKELSQLGKHKLGKGCIYFNKLADINVEVLQVMIEKTYLLRTKEKVE